MLRTSIFAELDWAPRPTLLIAGDVCDLLRIVQVSVDLGCGRPQASRLGHTLIWHDGRMLDLDARAVASASSLLVVSHDRVVVNQTVERWTVTASRVQGVALATGPCLRTIVDDGTARLTVAMGVYSDEWWASIGWREHAVTNRE